MDDKTKLPAATTPSADDQGKGGDGAVLTPEQQKVFDNALTKRLEEVNKKWETKLAESQSQVEERIKTERAEAEKMAKLSEAEKTKELFDKQKREVEAQSIQNKRDSNELTVTKMFAEQKIPQAFVQYCVHEDAKIAQERADKIAKTWNDEVANMKTLLMSGEPPKDFKNGSGAPKGKAPLAF